MVTLGELAHYEALLGSSICTGALGHEACDGSGLANRAAQGFVLRLRCLCFNAAQVIGNDRPDFSAAVCGENLELASKILYAFPHAPQPHARRGAI